MDETTTHTDLETRSQIAQALGKEVWPADRDTLLAVATDNGASDRVLALLSRLPGDRTWTNVQDVSVALGVASPEPEGAGAD
jgi:hypothetical protein